MELGSRKMTDYYDILGIPSSATQEEIKSKYRELSLMFHPDRIKTSLSEEMMKQINEAYSVLSNSIIAKPKLLIASLSFAVSKFASLIFDAALSLQEITSKLNIAM